MDAAYRLLQSRQRQVLWGAVQQLLEAEAAEVDGGGSGHVLAAELVKRATGPARPPAAALGPLLLSLFLKAVDGEELLTLYLKYTALQPTPDDSGMH